MRVLLINSNLRDDFLAAPPIGLCYVAEAAETAGHEVRVLDLCFQRNVKKALAHAVSDPSPQVVGISVRNIDNANMLRPVFYLPEAKKIVDMVRELTGAPIVVGGSGAGMSPEAVLRFLGADFIVVSEGEKSFLGLLESFGRGETPDAIPGVGMLRNGEFRFNRPAPAGFPALRTRLGRWIDMNPYRERGCSYGIQTKRGCTQRCIYCTYNQLLEGNRLRLRSPKDVVDELEEAVGKYKPEAFEFVDSVFNDPVDHCSEILEEILRRNLKARFTAMGVSPKNLDDKFLELMWRAGFTSFMITPESASPTMIESYGKGFTADDVVRAAEAINRTRFTVMWYFLMGGPGETESTLEETVGFVSKYLKRETRPPYNMANFFLGVRVYRNTKLWHIAVREGLANPDGDGLSPVWYLSRDLDPEFAVKRLTEAAASCPEISLGFDEGYVDFSRLITFAGRLLRVPKPYWRHTWGLNRLLIKTGLRFVFRPKDLVGRIRERIGQGRG